MINMLRTIPKAPSTQLKIVLHLQGFLIGIHMKHGYANVIRTATPPMIPARLGKNGSATDIKNAKQPKKILNPVSRHQGHGFVHAASKSEFEIVENQHCIYLKGAEAVNHDDVEHACQS